MDDVVRCTWCGAEADGSYGVGYFGTEQVRYLPIWTRQTADHRHTAAPPSPEELERVGHETLMRILAAADGLPPSKALQLPSEMIR